MEKQMREIVLAVQRKFPGHVSLKFEVFEYDTYTTKQVETNFILYRADEVILHFDTLANVQKWIDDQISYRLENEILFRNYGGSK